MNEPAASALRPGDRVGDYVVVAPIGKGGMGVVLAARHVSTGASAAIKVVGRGRHADEGVVDRFLQEIRAAEAIKHPHVAKVIDAGELEDGTPYLLMERLHGRPLNAVIRERAPLPVELALDYILQACEGVQAAHSLGIIHRDLKPANLFVTEQGGTDHIKVLDFGISKVPAILGQATDASGLTSAGGVMGSPFYMAPEQLTDARNVDVRTDIWSLGIILFEMLTRRRPFPSATPGGYFASIVSEPPARLEDLRADAPEDLGHILRTCLSRDPEDRFNTVDHLSSALVRLRRGPPKREPEEESSLHLADRDALATYRVPPTKAAAPTASPVVEDASLPTPAVAAAGAIVVALVAWLLASSMFASPDESSSEVGDGESSRGASESSLQPGDVTQVSKHAVEGWRKPIALGLYGCGRARWCAAFSSTTPFGHGFDAGIFLLDDPSPRPLADAPVSRGGIDGLVRGEGHLPAHWIFHETDDDRVVGRAMAVGDDESERVYALVGPSSGFGRQVRKSAWAPGSPPRGAILWSQMVPAKRDHEAAEGRAQPRYERVHMLTVAAERRWVTQELPGLGAVLGRPLASPRSFALTAGREDVFWAYFIDDEGQVSDKVDIRSPRDRRMTEQDAILTNADALIFVASTRGRRSTGQGLVVGEIGRDRKPKGLRELRSPNSLRVQEDVRLVDCGPSAWVLRHWKAEGVDQFDVYRLADKSPAPTTVWRGALDGFVDGEKVAVSCSGRRASFVAIDERAREMLFVEWFAG